MDDEAAKLKAELAELNAKCQLARDNEVRYALQRSRLETERAQLLVKLVEATTTAVPAAVLAAPYRVVLQMPAPENVPRPLPNPASLVDRRRKHKPDGLPSIAAMITATLKETPNLRPTEIADLIRKQWWPDLQTPTISTTAWRMVRSGHLTQQDGRYALNGAGPRQNGSCPNVSVDVA